MHNWYRYNTAYSLHYIYNLHSVETRFIVHQRNQGLCPNLKPWIAQPAPYSDSYTNRNQTLPHTFNLRLFSLQTFKKSSNVNDCSKALSKWSSDRSPCLYGLNLLLLSVSTRLRAENEYPATIAILKIADSTIIESWFWTSREHDLHQDHQTFSWAVL